MGPGPDALTLAERELDATETVLRGVERRFDGACKSLGEANRRVIPSALKGGKPIVLSPERVKAEKSCAMWFLNTRGRPAGGSEAPRRGPRLAGPPGVLTDPSSAGEAGHSGRTGHVREPRPA